MPDRNDLIKAVLSIAVKILIGLIPALSGLLGVPVLGWLAGWAISWLTGLLYDFVERLARFKGIDDEVAADKLAAQKALEALKLVVVNPSTPEAYDAARSSFDSAVSRFGRIRVQ